MNTIREHAEHINEHGQDYLDKQLEYYKLSLFKKIMKGATSMVKFLIIGAILFNTVIFISLAGAWQLAGWLDNIPLAFIIMGGIYIFFLLMFIFVINKYVERRMLKESSKIFFE